MKPLSELVDCAEKGGLGRSLSAFQLVFFGIGAIIGTGIFVLTAEAADKAGPGMVVSFAIAGAICGLTALTYAEFAGMIPVSGSAYTYAYATLGEPIAWAVGWALVLEYSISSAAVSVGWSGYIVGLLESAAGVQLPHALVHGPFEMDGGIFNLPAFLVCAFATGLLLLGTRESARINMALVAAKLTAILLFLVLTLPLVDPANFQPFMPNGFFARAPEGAVQSLNVGVTAAAASIFFAYIGFDAVSTAAEESKNPARSVPIGVLGSLAVCTLLYMAIAIAAVGSVGGQPGGELARSDDALAFVLRQLDHPAAAALVGTTAALALPSVILVVLFGQTRIFFAMARDGMLPRPFARIHPRYRTPHVATLCTGLFVAIAGALFPVGKLAEFANAGTLFAFAIVAIGVMILRRTQPARRRSFRMPAIWLTAPLAVLGCTFLFFQLSTQTQFLFLAWSLGGLFIYVLYGRRHSHLARGIVEPITVPGPVPGASE